MLGIGVLERVRERLLDDAVGRQVDRRRQRPRRALDLERDRQAGRAHLLDEAVEPPEARLRLVARRPRAERRAPGAGRRAPPGRPSRSPGSAHAPARLDFEDVVGGGGLHDDHAERMRDDVVQLARDPRLLLGRGAPRVGLASVLEPVGLLLDLADVRPARADAVAEQPERHQEHEPRQRVAELELADHGQGRPRRRAPRHRRQRRPSRRSQIVASV